KLWHTIKERFSSSQASNRARIFNDFLYIKFQEDGVENFVTNVKVAIKIMVDVGIDLPQDILLYLVLIKFPTSLQILKRQIMHSDKELSVEFNLRPCLTAKIGSRVKIIRRQTLRKDAKAVFITLGRMQIILAIL
ncbi:hypothetical protein VP01_8797g1, partial [Puccinia sorghi]